jgi:small-conductance mechanosensitive channel
MKELMTTQLEAWQEKVTPWLLTHGLKVIFIVIGAYIANKIIAAFVIKAVRAAVRPDSHSSHDAELRREDTLIQIFKTTINISIITIALLMVLQEFGIEIGPILAAAGIIGLALGFGGQYLIRDVISGLFIILENQYRIGDIISFDNASGTVTEITLRKTTLRDLDGTIHHIPHGEVKKVSNSTKDFSRINMDLGISYNADLEHVIKVVNKIGADLSEDSYFKDFINKPPQFLRVQAFADSAVIIKILGETLPSKQWEVAGELRKRIKITFDKEGIEIPFPQLVVHQPSLPKK